MYCSDDDTRLPPAHTYCSCAQLPCSFPYTLPIEHVVVEVSMLTQAVIRNVSPPPKKCFPARTREPATSGACCKLSVMNVFPRQHKECHSRPINQKVNNGALFGYIVLVRPNHQKQSFLLACFDLPHDHYLRLQTLNFQDVWCDQPYARFLTPCNKK